MALSPQQIQDLLAKVRIRPPKRIILFRGARIRQGNGEYQGRSVLGLHRPGEDAIVLTHDSPSRTLFHESTHNMGVYGETATRTLAALYNLRSRFRLLPPLLVAKPKYAVRTVPASEIAKYMESYGLTNPPSEGSVIEMVLMD